MLRKILKTNQQQISWPRACLSRGAIALSLILSLISLELMTAPAAEARCLFWQACAQQRGRASNTRAGGKRTGRVQGGNDATLPYVISPRRTWVGTAPTTIRWHPVAGTETYTVRLWQWAYERDLPAFLLWETTVAAPGFTTLFPTINLQPGLYYTIEVITDSGISSNLDAGYDQSGFQVLFPEDYEILQQRLSEVNATDDQRPEAITLARAGVYFLEGMYGEALALLEPLANAPSASASASASELVYAALADTYSHMGLNLLAVEYYEQALGSAIATNNSLGQATTLVSLAEVRATLGQFPDSQRLLAQARQIYNQLGFTQEVATLENRLSILSTLPIAVPAFVPTTP